MPWIILMVLILIIIVTLAIAFLYKIKGIKHEPDYYAFFTIGIIWLFFGIIMLIQNPSFSFFFIIGLVFTIVGLANKNKWKKPKKWKDLSEEERKVKMIAIIGGLMALVIGVVVFLLVSFY
ncbi:MAG: hypothetical protein JSW73_03730 [Candidatus Woesearchaeota archaeon]|nr:MAG: hypothetical protein JSW73_03730 [Candidatus Woesearchaeota archaeon]